MSGLTRDAGIGLDLELPGAERRERLLDALSRVVALQGYERLVQSRVLLPIHEHFPDRVAPGARGVRTLLRRLGTYAGLGDLGVHVTLYDQEAHAELDHRGVGCGGLGAAAWFAGIRAGVCEYGVDRRELRDPEELIGTLAHEVAHAFRGHHGLVVTTRELEEPLTDVTTVYLGFGVFLLNSSQSFKTGGWSEGGDRLLYERRSRGYLSPAEIALLLGAQAVARDTTREERAAIARALSPNHAQLFKDACALFVDHPASLRTRLGVPEPDAWPDNSTFESVPAPFADDDETDETDEDLERAPENAPPGRAFRLHGDRAAFFGVLGALFPMLPATAGLLEGWPLLGALAGGGALGALLGKALPHDVCTGCRGRLARAAERCPHCGAHIEGTVRSEEERLAAEEQLESAEPEYDYFADDSVPTDEKHEALLLTAIYVEWSLRRGLASETFRSKHPKLVERAQRGEIESGELCELWSKESELLDETGAAFTEFYFDENGGWHPEDYALLNTASQIRDTRKTYDRVQALLDRRFADWAAKRGRSGGSASSTL